MRYKVILNIVVMIFCMWSRTYAIDNKVKVSIIVPVYNVDRYVGMCMDSLINQTLKEIEIICIDDGSTDGSGKILDEYARKDNRIVVIHQDNKGVSVARNRGLAYGPKGEYITFVDSDDYVDKDTYAVMYKIAKSHNNDMVSFGKLRFKGYKKCSILNKFIKLISRFTTNKRLNVSNDKEDFREMLLYNGWEVTNKLYKTKFLKQSGVEFKEDIVFGEDLVYNFMIIPYVRKYERVGHIFYNYRKRPGSLCARNKNIKNIKDCIKAIPYVCNQWREYGILEGNEAFVLDSLMRGFWFCLKDTAKSNASYANEIAESFGKDIYNANVLTRANKYTKDCVEQLEKYRKT